MKTALSIAPFLATLILGGLAAPPGVRAMELVPPAARQLYTCERGGLSRVSAVAEPAPCCTGLLGCPQMLSNTGLVRPKRSNRT